MYDREIWLRRAVSRRARAPRIPASARGSRAGGSGGCARYGRVDESVQRCRSRGDRASRGSSAGDGPMCRGTKLVASTGAAVISRASGWSCKSSMVARGSGPRGVREGRQLRPEFTLGSRPCRPTSFSFARCLPSRWRVLVTPAAAGAENMALDEALMEPRATNRRVDAARLRVVRAHDLTRPQPDGARSL